MANTTNSKANGALFVTGLFKDKESAECAYNALGARGYSKDDADVVMSGETRDKYYSGGGSEDSELGTKATEGMGAGAAIGGTVGAVLAAVAAIGTSIVLPGIGLVVAGPLAAALVGAGAGGLTGGLIGGLVGSGIPEEHAAAYESGIKSGGIMLRVTPRTNEDAAEIENQWRSCGGEQIYSNASRSVRPRGGADVPQNKADEVAIPVVQEELQVGKRSVERGGVRVETHITEQPVEETVRLREEQIEVERCPVNRPVGEEDLTAVKDGEIRIPLVAEVPVVSKEARVIEEVVISKNVAERSETIHDTVRRSEVEVEQQPPAERGKGKGSA